MLLPHPALFYKRIKIADRKYDGNVFGGKEVLTIHCFHAIRLLIVLHCAWTVMDADAITITC